MMRNDCALQFEREHQLSGFSSDRLGHKGDQLVAFLLLTTEVLAYPLPSNLEHQFRCSIEFL